MIYNREEMEDTDMYLDSAIFTKEDMQFLREYFDMPLDSQKFVQLLIRIGASDVLDKEEFSFFIKYLMKSEQV